jgi:hypothetical protein
MAVRGLRASISLSKYRLKAIAALRAKTIQKITRKKLYHGNSTTFPYTKPSIICGILKYFLHPYNPKKNPITAKGMAKMV